MGKKVTKNAGLHVIADLHGCDFTKLERLSKIQIKKSISGIIRDKGLTELGSYCHFFDSKISFTAVFCLAESHISIHTWPELGFVSLDIFVCNYSEDQSIKAKEIFKKLTALFPARKKRIRLLNR